MILPDKDKVFSTVEQVIWFLYLLIIGWAALLNQSFYSVSWLSFAFVISSLSAFYYIFLLFYPHYNQKSLRASAPIIVVLFLTVAWIYLQSYSGLIITIADFFSGVVISQSWFQADQISAFSMPAVQTEIMQQLVCLLVFIITLSLVRTRRRLTQLLFLFCVLMLLHASVGIGAKFAGMILVERALLDGHYDAARGWFVNRNHFSAMINLCMFGALGLLITFFWRHANTKSLSSWNKGVIGLGAWLYLAIFFVGFMALVMAESRAAFLGLFGSLVLILGTAARIEKNVAWNKFSLTLLALLGVLFLAMFGEQLLSRLLSESISLGERTEQWQRTFALIKQRFILGYGVGSYEAVFQYQRDVGAFREVVFDQAHNEFLHLWLEQGLVGLLLWLFILVFFVRTVIWQYLRCTSRFIKAIILAGLISFLSITLQSLVDFNMQIISLRLLFFVLMAAVISATTVVNKRK